MRKKTLVNCLFKINMEIFLVYCPIIFHKLVFNFISINSPVCILDYMIRYIYFH